MSHRRRAAANEAVESSPVSLIPRVDPEKLNHIKLTWMDEDDILQKLEVPKTALSSVEEFLLCLIEFRAVAAEWDLEDADLFKYYRRTVHAVKKSDWDAAASGKPLTTAGFEDALRAFVVGTLLREEAIDQLKTYLTTTAKPWQLLPHEVASRLRVLSQYLVEMQILLGEQPDGLSEQEMKNIFLRMMPTHWRHHFRLSGQRITDEALTFADLVGYMTTAHALELNTWLSSSRPTGFSDILAPSA